jgi:peptidoglycan/LPS O-acetylase OafA/YrhL
MIAQSSPLGILFNGHGAVVLFFVLSGFVLRRAIGARQASRLDVMAIKFLLSRLFRLFPVIVAVVATYAIAAWLVSGSFPPFGFLLRNAALIEASVNGAFWTLQVELFGSALVLVAFLLERRFGIGAPMLLLAVLMPLSFVGKAGQITAMTHSGHLYPFLVGYAAALLPGVKSRLIAAVLLGFAIAIFYAVPLHGSVFAQWGLLATASSAVIIIHVLTDDRFAGWSNWPPLHWLGAVSYSLYAVHFVVVEWAARLAGTINGLLPRSLAIAILLVLTGAVSLLLAAVMHALVEKPGMDLGRKLNRR